MSADQLVGLAANAAIYVGLIAFVLYRQMGARPVRGARLVPLPAVLALLGIQQLLRQPLAAGSADAMVLVLGLLVGVAVGLWRGRTFRLWADAGRAMAKGTPMTLVTWAVLIAVRLPFAFLGLSGHRPQGFAVGELLLALAATFAAQNAVLWARASRLEAGGPRSAVPPGSLRR